MNIILFERIFTSIDLVSTTSFDWIASESATTTDSILFCIFFQQVWNHLIKIIQTIFQNSKYKSNTAACFNGIRICSVLWHLMVFEWYFLTLSKCQTTTMIQFYSRRLYIYNAHGESRASGWSICVYLCRI